MQAQDIERYLAELGQELQNQGLRHPLRILLIGGAFMLTQKYSRPATNDIDVLLKDIADPTGSALYQTFKAAVRAVARREKLPEIWINDIIGDFLRDTGIVPEGTLWRTYTLLEVYVPPGEYILALKLLANRPKDRDDISALCQQLQLHTREQAQLLLDRYIPDRRVQEINDVDATLDDLFA